MRTLIIPSFLKVLTEDFDKIYGISKSSDVEASHEQTLNFSVLRTENMNAGPTGRSRRETFPKAFSFAKKNLEK